MRANARAARITIFVKDRRRRLTRSCEPRGRTMPTNPRVHLDNRNCAFLAKKAVRAINIFVAAGDLVTLAYEQVCKIGPGCAGSQDEDEPTDEGDRKLLFLCQEDGSKPKAS